LARSSSAFDNSGSAQISVSIGVAVLGEHGLQISSVAQTLLTVLVLALALVPLPLNKVRGKGLVEQVPDRVDHRQKLLQMTAAGAQLWSALPDLTLIHKAAFAGIDDAAIATAVSVLQIATERLDTLSRKGTDT